MDYNFFTI